MFDIIYRSLDVKPEEDEPMMNVLVLYEADRWVVFVSRARNTAPPAILPKEKPIC